jgi:hypothetical protein
LIAVLAVVVAPPHTTDRPNLQKAHSKEEVANRKYDRNRGINHR